jgi:serine/threonine protein kinase
MADWQSTRLGKYLLLEKIAAGGMAQLYRAKITGVQGFEKLIAIKMILPHLLGEKELISSFIDEAKLAALLSHQNIVQIYDFGRMENSYYIAMEYLRGKDLRYIFQKSKERKLPLNVEQALYVISRICSGLDYAHKLKDFQGKPLNIIHRDISPQNILITYEGEVKILDFGIAKAASQSTITQHGMIKGKVAYMSPEQASGQKIDLRSDIFSIGILLYELLTHTRMFTGDT